MLHYLYSVTTILNINGSVTSRSLVGAGLLDVTDPIGVPHPNRIVSTLVPQLHNQLDHFIPLYIRLSQL